ncbi:MAG: hypothetical protein FJ014_05905 [Chloroflexi bacterium]|nr:hypothetical protein [Chloroflexota bacterium]
MLTKLRVKNYKSLEDVTILLKPLTVFVGPNNAGKSNILDCLLFLQELLELGAPTVSSPGPPAEPQRLVLNRYQDQTRFPILSTLLSAMRSWAFYSFIPAQMAQPTPARRDLRLQKEGANISSVFHTFQSEWGESFAEVEELLKTAVPEMERLLTPLTEEGQTYLAMEERGFPLRIPSWAMSDGTLRFLGQLAALLSPDPPTMACFEEPENCIHPGLLELVVDVLKSASRKTQVLATTHSPNLLNFLAPEDLIIVEKVDGKTQCRGAKDVTGVKEALKTLG